MRHLAIQLTFLVAPTIAVAAPPLCTSPALQTAPSAARPAADLGAPSKGEGHAQRQVTAVPAKTSDAILPKSLVALPFVNHVAASGSTLFDMGVSHGVHGVFARNGDQLMIFQMTPDGEAAVAGAVTEISAAQLTAFAAGNVRDLGVKHGLRTLFVQSGPQFQIYYVTPDGERVIPGVMWAANGKNITRQQVSSVPGAVTTVVVNDDQGASGKATSASPVATLPLLQQAAAGSIGPANAPHIWMLIDPQCIYSIRAFQMLQPYASGGRLRISVVPVSVLDYEDHGASTKAALSLLSMPADKIVAAWQARDLNGPTSPAGHTLLSTNMAIAEAIHLTGTPTFIWRKVDGSEGRLDGLPTDPDALVASVGS